MLISNIINDSFGLITKQLRFYCWHFRRNLDHRQRQELVELLYEQRFESLANKIKSLNQSAIADCRQQVGKLLFDYCFNRNRRHQLIQLIESDLVDIDVRLDNYGRTLLHRAAYNLDLELVRILIEQNVNIRLRDYAGNTALHIAIQSYRNGAVIYGNGPGVVQNLSSIIRLLLEADKNLQDERYRRKKIRLLNNDDTDQVATKLRGSHGKLNSKRINSQTSYTSTICGPIDRRKEIESYMLKKSNSTGKLNDKFKETSTSLESKELDYQAKQNVPSEDNSTENINPILLEDMSSPLIDTKNAFGRTALHYCVLVVGEQHLAHFVKLLIDFGADVDAIDTKLNTPLYCLVKRPGIQAIRQKCLAIKHLLESGCDDLGLAIDTKTFFNERFFLEMEKNISNILQSKVESSIEPIFYTNQFIRVPSLKHISRLKLIKLEGEAIKNKKQVKITLPKTSPKSLNLFMNRKILDQTELF